MVAPPAADTLLHSPAPTPAIVTESPGNSTQSSVRSAPAIISSFTMIDTVSLVSAHIGSTVVVNILAKKCSPTVRDPVL